MLYVHITKTDTFGYNEPILNRHHNTSDDDNEGYFVPTEYAQDDEDNDYADDMSNIPGSPGWIPHEIARFISVSNVSSGEIRISLNVR